MDETEYTKITEENIDKHIRNIKQILVELDAEFEEKGRIVNPETGEEYTTITDFFTDNFIILYRSDILQKI